MRRALIDWFEAHQRDLPWRKNRTGYRVWVSEVMLQQTQVNVVLPYFLRWMELFPTIEALAQAPREKVIKAWEGLGYYSRARNLHEGAQAICANYGGAMPKTVEELKQIKGIGPYTAGAIASLAFGEQAIAVDGNVKRVISRLYMIEASIDTSQGQSLIEELAQALLCHARPALVVEGLIELGALVCLKQPRCWQCPLQNTCQAFQAQRTEDFPVRKKRYATTHLHRFVYILLHEGHVLVSGVKDKGVMQDLWHFPFFESKKAEFDIGHYVNDQLGYNLSEPDVWEPVKHGFTRYCAHLYPHFWHLYGDRPSPKGREEWVSVEALRDLPFCGGHRELRDKLLKIRR